MKTARRHRRLTLALAVLAPLAAVVCPAPAEAATSPEADPGDLAMVLFEPWSSKLAAGESDHLDRLATRFRQQADLRAILYVPQRKDPGTRRFLASRVATVDRELAKRGVSAVPAPAPLSVDNENGIGLGTVRLGPGSTPGPAPGPAPLALLPGASGDLAPAAATPPVLPDRGLAGWQVRAAVPGRAWVVGPGDALAGPVEIREGQDHPALGHVERIAQEGARWTVRTSRGRFGGGP